MAVTIVIGDLRNVGTLANPRDVTVEGDTTQVYDVAVDPPEWRFAIQVASAQAIERRFAGTITAQATNILNGRFHPGIITKTRIIWTDRWGTVHTANVLDVDDTEGAGVETVALVSEIVP
jgi:hypothetical protein